MLNLTRLPHHSWLFNIYLLSGDPPPLSFLLWKHCRVETQRKKNGLWLYLSYLAQSLHTTHLMRITFVPGHPLEYGQRREITHRCQVSKGKQGACHTAESRDPVSPVSGVYPTAQGFKTTYQPVCQISDLMLCRANILLSTSFFMCVGSVLLSVSFLSCLLTQEIVFMYVI